MDTVSGVKTPLWIKKKKNDFKINSWNEKIEFYSLKDDITFDWDLEMFWVSFTIQLQVNGGIRFEVIYKK